MNSLVTLSKTSPDFKAYLEGTFSKELRAIPVQTLNVNSASETVTFRIVPVKEIKCPSGLVLILHLFKVRSFLLVLAPLFLVMTKNVADRSMSDPLNSIIATIGVLFAFIAVNLRNDYMDHMKGIDRVLQKSGSRAIQNGWVTAARVKSFSSLFLLFAIVLAIPLVITVPEVFLVILAGLIIGLWAQFQKEHSFKYQIGGEFALFIMLGPLLTVGFQLAMGAPYDQEIFWMGCVWGWLVLFIVQLRNFMNIFDCGQAGFKNTVTWLGFDKSRRMLALWWGMFLVFNLSYHVLFAGFYWGFYLALALGFLSINFILKLKSTSSPVGSELRSVFRSGFNLFLLTIGLWVFECLWYLWAF